jgi:hypothetical protein
MLAGRSEYLLPLHCMYKRTSHKLLAINLVRLVENTTNLIFVSLQNVDSSFEFIRNVQLVGVE